MEDSSLCITATVLSGHWTYEFVHLTLRHTLKLNEEWTIRVIPKNSFLITCSSYSKRDHALMLKVFTKPGGAIYLQSWSDEEFEPSPALEVESWTKVDGFPEFLKSNVPAVEEVMKPMGRVLAIEDCYWSQYDHTSFYLKMQFYEGIGNINTFAAQINNKVYFIKVQRCTHAHPGTRPELLFVSNREEEVVPCLHHYGWEWEMDSDERFNAMIQEAAELPPCQAYFRKPPMTYMLITKPQWTRGMISG